MFLFFCCSSDKDDLLGNGPRFSGMLEEKQKAINRILLEFMSEESKIGMKDTQCIDMIEKILVVSNQEEIQKKDLVQVYKQMDTIN
jgi:hypothetical protein